MGSPQPLDVGRPADSTAMSAGLHRAHVPAAAGHDTLSSFTATYIHLFEELSAVSTKHLAHSKEREQVGNARIGPLQQLRAERELFEMRQAEAASRAASDGMSQRDIARALGISQSTVHRLLRRDRAKLGDPVLRARFAARAAALGYALGLVSRGTLIGRYSGSSPGTQPPVDGLDGYVPGVWDEMVTAYLDGLIDEDTYSKMLDRRRAEETSE